MTQAHKLSKKYLDGILDTTLSNTLFSPKHKLVYIATPKVACTAIKWWFAKLLDVDSHIREDISSHESEQELKVHDLFPKIFPQYARLNINILKEVLSDPNNLAFSFVRNPYPRIFSAWQSKLLLKEPIQFCKYSDCPFTELPYTKSSDIAFAFEQFLEHIFRYESPEFRDVHWTPQFQHLMVGSLENIQVSKLEEPQDLIKTIARHLPSGIISPLEFKTTNESLIPYSEKLLTNRSIELIRNIYAEDFHHFKYADDPPPGQDLPSPSFLVNAVKAISMIRSRHLRLIEIKSYLYDSVTEKNQKLSELASAIQERDQRLYLALDSISERDQWLLDAKSAIDERDERLIQAAGEIEQKISLINQLREVMTEREKRITDLESAGVQREEILRHLNQSLAEQDKQISGLNKSVGERDKQIGVLIEAISTKDGLLRDLAGKMEGLSESVSERDKQIGALNESLAKRDVQISGLKRHMTDKENAISQKEYDLHHLRAYLDLVKSSWSWRLTAPIRAVTEKVKSVVKTLKRYRLAAWIIWTHRKTGIFDREWYLLRYPDVRKSGMNPFLHFLMHGIYEGRAPHGLFTEDNYKLLNPDISGSGALHYIIHGWRESRHLQVLFDKDFYLKSNKDVKESGVDPIIHYLKFGFKEGRRPHRYINPKFYLNSYNDIKESGIDPLTHYLHWGWKEGRRIMPLFDTSFYLNHNPDIRDSGIEPLTHYMISGGCEGRNPNAIFDARKAWVRVPAIKETDQNPLFCYLDGKWDKDPSPEQTLFLSMAENEV